MNNHTDYPEPEEDDGEDITDLVLAQHYLGHSLYCAGSMITRGSMCQCGKA